MTAGPPALPPALHPDRLLLAESGRAVVHRADEQADTARRPRIRPGAGDRHPPVDRHLEHRPQALCLDRDRRRHPPTPHRISELNSCLRRLGGDGPLPARHSTGWRRGPPVVAGVTGSPPISRRRHRRQCRACIHLAGAVGVRSAAVRGRPPCAPCTHWPLRH